MEAILLAGGLGTRLRSRLVDLPKSMAPVAGRPFLAFLLDQLAAAGFSRVLVSVGYRRKAILDAFGSKYRGLPLHYVIEPEPRGTGGAIRLALADVREDAVLVMNADTWVDLDFEGIFQLHARSGSAMTMAVTQVSDTARYGGVVVQGQRVVGFIEKGRTGPGWINAGAYVLASSFPWPHGLAQAFSFENDVLMPVVKELRPVAFRHEGHFLDIGVPEDLDRAQTELAGNNQR